MDRTLVFVYGTLKRDFPNYVLIEDLIRSGDASFVSAGRTAARLPLVVGPWGIPFLLPLPGSGRRVSGELFALSACGLARIDDLEGTHRGHYERLPVAVVANPGDGGDEDEDEEAAAAMVEAEAYYAHRRYAVEMWRRSGEKGLRAYSEEDVLGYVRPNERPRDTTFLDRIRIFLASDNAPRPSFSPSGVVSGSPSPLMATNWFKSLSCKSNAVADGVTNPKPLSKKAKNPLPFASCRRSDSIRDVISPFPKCPSSPLPKRSYVKGSKPKPESRPSPPPPASVVVEAAPPANSFPALVELPEGHSSRRVVEIIFRSSWGLPPFAGVIEMLFRVQHPPRATARFEEYRSAVRAAASGATRCAADGNEMMRFHCAASSASAGGDGEVYDAAAWGKAGEAIRTFDGSGGAHASWGGGAGRRAMLLCRVIAGRIRAGSEPESELQTGFDSDWAGKGELMVFDPRAVLPCFLIIYKI